MSSKSKCKGGRVYGCTIGFWVSVILLFWFCFVEGPKRAARAKSWADPGRWIKADCDVVFTGIAMRGDCEWEHDLQKSAAFSECPGYSICGSEGENCICDGEVKYMAQRHGGMAPLHDPNVHPDYASLVLHGRTQSVDCSHGPSKAFKVDPAPGVSKACFCTPQSVLEKLGDNDPKRYRCGTKDLKEYADTSRRLDAENDEAYEADEHATELLEIPGSNSGRRRYGSCSAIYQPWALVKVTGTDSFSQEAKELYRCAYNYGTPIASRTENETEANELTHQWNLGKGSSSGGLDCAVHQPHGGDLEYCAVALGDFRKLVKEEQGSHAGYVWYLLLVCCCCCCFTALSGYLLTMEDCDARELPEEEGDYSDLPQESEQ